MAQPIQPSDDLGASLLSLPGVVGAVALSFPVAWFGPRALLIKKPTLVGFAASLIGGLLGSTAFGSGGTLARVLLGLTTGLLVSPLAMPVLLIRWDRVHQPIH